MVSLMKKWQTKCMYWLSMLMNLILLHNSHIVLLLLCNINEAFWLSWISLACTLVAAIGGLVGFSVRYIILPFIVSIMYVLVSSVTHKFVH